MHYLIGRSDSHLFDARIDVEGSSVILHSRGGATDGRPPRNTGYALALQIICERAKRGGYLRRVLIDSAVARRLPEQDRVLLERAEIDEVDAAELAKLIRTRMRRHGQATGVSGGNSTKQVRFDFDLSHHSVITALRLRKADTSKVAPSDEGVAEAIESVFTISDAPTVVHEGFNVWREAMLEDARRDGDLWIQASERFVLRNQADRKSSHLGARTALGIDPTGGRWAVQINEAATPGDLSVTSAIALDQDGRPHLLRQGRLNPPTPEEDPILYAEFAALTGWTPVLVINGDTNIKRDWYIVSPLDVPSAEIREWTARFVDGCAVARSKGRGSGAPEDRSILTELSANDETGGTYATGARSAQDPRIIRKWQGEVWTAMAKLLRDHDFNVDKPRPARRYEVDAEVVRGKLKLLVEIKSGAAAADVYSGLGQLLLYAKLLPRLSAHRPVLLLPALPHPLLAEAVAACGVTLCTFDCEEVAGVITTSFSDAFMGVCGLGKWK